MSIRKVVKYGEPSLREPSKEVHKVSQKIKNLVADLLDTMYKQNGVGLAAVQVGILKRVVVIDVGDGMMELVNPEITDKSGEQREIEGCLSLPGKSGVTLRPMKVQVKAQDRNGKFTCHTVEHGTCRSRFRDSSRGISRDCRSRFYLLHCTADAEPCRPSVRKIVIKLETAIDFSDLSNTI